MGLPLHPVFVHFGVVFIIVFSILQLIALVSSRFQALLDWLLPVGGFLTAVFAFLTKQTGEILGHATHDVNWHPHGEWGDKAGALGVFLGGLAILLWFVQVESLKGYPAERMLIGIQEKLKNPTLVLILKVLTALVACTAIVMTILAGHTGASLVWNK